MEQKIGKVIEVYIPVKKNQDIMDSTKIGFKIQTEDKIITIEEDQNEYNVSILREDLVYITKRTISNKTFIEIEKVNGEENE